MSAPAGPVLPTIDGIQDAAFAAEQARPGKMESAGPILDALRRLHEARSRSMQPMRDILEEVLHQAERIERDAAPVDAAGIGRILDDLDKLDERFLEHVTERVLVLVNSLAQLEKKPLNVPLSREAVTSIFLDIDRLQELAEQVHATAITLFLQGLRVFLTVVAQSTTPGASQRVRAVQGRLAALVPLAKQWVAIGRLERTAIIDILPV